MLKVTIQLIPASGGEPRILGEAYICNTGLGDREIGHYECKIMKSPEYSTIPGIWKKSSVMSFPRRNLGPWDLLLRCLKNCIGSRNP